MTQPSYYYDSDRPSDRRRRPSGERSSTWKVVDLQAIHHKIIQMLHKGNSNRYIARELGVSEVMVSNVKNSPAAKDKLEIMEAVADIEAMDVRKEIIKRAPAVLETLHEILNDKNTGNALKARICFDQLDRAGFAAVKQLETRNLHAHKYIDDDDIKALKERGLKLAREAALVIDI